METLKGKISETTVAGKKYTYWPDFIQRGTFAENEAGEIEQISWSGYISNDLTVRKAIARAYGLPTFRK